MGRRNKATLKGPEFNEDGIPYDYIVIVDSGSKGSRAYVYHWLNPMALLSSNVTTNTPKDNKLKLVKKINLDDEASTSSSLDKYNGDSDSDDEEGPNKPQHLPKVTTKKNWHKKIKPGISSFNSSPQKLGNHHIKYLLQLTSAVVPKSQHYRTPFFLHSTAGMRLLPPNEQQSILDSICEYVQQNSDFYLPDCASHINVIDGDEEGLYGWLSINYMIGSFDHPNKHQHGKNHTTYGLLDMGGASTQVVFSPNSTETQEHLNNLFHIRLARQTRDVINQQPQSLDFKVYSDSFLGFGMYQAHKKYLTYLAEKMQHENVDSYYASSPISDSCLPKGYMIKGFDLDLDADFTGESDFQSCLTSIFPVISNSTHSSMEKQPSTNCKEFGDGKEASSCLLNELIPAFDFDVNHFFGVSGYWDSIQDLLSYKDLKLKRSDKNRVDKYDYKTIYKETQRICSKSFEELMIMNNAKPVHDQLQEEELAQLCFKTSWILNFLHLGLGFPRLGIDDVNDTKAHQYKSLQLVDQVDGSKFSWTLGRALLYANDEYIQAFNNITLKNNPKSTLLKRSGFYHTTSINDFHYGAEQRSISPRPLYESTTDSSNIHHYSYEYSEPKESSESKWNIQPHRWYGLLVFGFLISFFAFLLLGKSGRSHIVKICKEKFNNISNYIKNRKRYHRVEVGDIEGGIFNNYELRNLSEQSTNNNQNGAVADIGFKKDNKNITRNNLNSDDDDDDNASKFQINSDTELSNDV